MSMNCSTPVPYWLSLTLKELSRWIHANNELKRKEREAMEEKK